MPAGVASWFARPLSKPGASRDDLRQLAVFRREIDRWATWRDADGRPAFAIPTARSSTAPEVRALESEWAAYLGSRLCLATNSGTSAIHLALAAAPAFAQADLAQKKNCMACHAVDKKVLGPAYKDVAAKYAGQKDAADKLAAKVVKGGSGVWGNIPMPANPQVNDAEAKQLVQWILTLK